MRRFTVPVTTDDSGAAAAYTPVFSGAISSIRYVKTDFAAGVDFTITAEATGETLWAEDNVNASKTCAPRMPTHDNAGTASLYAAGGEPVEDHYNLAADRVKIVIAAGGNTKSGVFYITTL